MATNGARFTKTFTHEQKQAILKACLIDGHTVAQARRMARAGQLDVAAFEIGTYAYNIVRDGREGFEATNETALQRAIDHEMHAAELDALAHIRAVRQAFKRDAGSNPDALKRATRALADIQRARRDAAAQRFKPANQRGKATNARETTPDDVNTPRSNVNTVADLLELVPDGLNPASSSSRSGSLTDAPNPDRIGVQSPGLDAA